MFAMIIYLCFYEKKTEMIAVVSLSIFIGYHLTEVRLLTEQLIGLVSLLQSLFG
jgi:hypothetical protein